jgi:hypothetical protein
MAQHMDALDHANAIRKGRATLRRQVRRGDCALACELLLAQDERIQTMPIGEFLEWLPKVGPRRAAGIMESAFDWFTVSTYGREIRKIAPQTRAKLVEEIQSGLGVA